MTASHIWRPTFAHTPPHRRWGGTFQFDLDEYIEWRAREEGVDPATVCARGAGKAYDAAKGAAAAAAAVSEAAAGGGGAGTGISAPEILGAEGGALRKGTASKRGSGRGLFSSVRWKPKLLVLTPTSVAYFDQLDESDQNNKVARLITLDASASVTRVTPANLDTRGPAGQFTVRAQARDYLFGVEGTEEADAWVAAVGEAVRAAVEMMAAGAAGAGAPAAGAPAAVMGE